MATCPSCGKELPAGEFPFCPFCTAPLTEQPPAETLEERRVVSVLFCDVVGFTAASADADPEDVRARMELYYAQARDAIEVFGGTVEKFIGDAVMAVFGAPIAHEDDPERAVRAGLRIVEVMKALTEADRTLELSVRVGVNTGEVLVAVGRFADGSTALVLGDVVNTAARIQAAAPVDGVAVSEQTYRRTASVFVFEPLAAAAAKGKKEPLSLWRALQPRSSLGHEVFRSPVRPFVGRHDERSLLEQIFERCDRESETQLVTLVGQPGAGKSRLVAELLRYVDERPSLVRWRQGRCLPYGQGIAFWALGEIVKAHAGIYESDPPEVALEKLDAMLPDVEEKAWWRARLLPLVGVDSGEPAERDELFSAWRRLLELIAADRAAVVVVEDLHWADPALVEFLRFVAESSAGVPLLLLCTTRPELLDRQPGWAEQRANEHVIRLSPLPADEMASLIDALLDRDVPEALREAIVERAEGNPLYAEELVRLLSDQGDADAALVLPDSLQSLIAARLDLLTPAQKHVLQDAAVLGKVFWAGAIRQMRNGDAAEVRRALDALAGRELIRLSSRSSVEGEEEYAFWHVLVRDVAYAQIPRKDRLARHLAAAGWIERQAAARIEDVAEVVAHHYLQALELAEAMRKHGDAEELRPAARRFLMLGGERALGLDTLQAEARFARALELTPGGHPERPRLLVRWADAVSQAGRGRQAAAALEEALDELRNEPYETASALALLSRIEWGLGLPRQLDLAVEAVSLLEALEPGPPLVDALCNLSVRQRAAGRTREAVATAERAIALTELLGLPESARALGDHGIALAELGEREGLAELERAHALMVEQGAGRSAAVAMNNLAYLRLPLEGHHASFAALEQGLAFARLRGLVEVELAFEANLIEDLAALGRTGEALELAAELAPQTWEAGDVYGLTGIRAVEAVILAGRGEHASALSHLDWLLDTVRPSGLIEPLVAGLASAAVVLSQTGDHLRAHELLVELEAVSGARDNINYPLLLPALVRAALAASAPELARRLIIVRDRTYPLHANALRSCHAQLFEAAGDHADAATRYADAANRWQQFGNVPERGYALLGQGRCLTTVGKSDEAETPLDEARELFASMGYQPALAEINALQQD